MASKTICLKVGLVCRSLDVGGRRGGTMKYVYMLQSISHPKQCYIGLTSDIEKRLNAHNAGQSPHTAKFKPWKLTNYFAFSDESKAAAFEKYLKTGSGRAFVSKHF